MSSEVALIVCHEHKFIFLKTRKTAGTSIEISLSRLTGPGDVVTKLSPRDEKIRLEMGIQPRGYRGRFNPMPEILFGSYRERIQAIREFVKGKKFRNHSSSIKIRNRVARGVWDSYFKFCFERNPWDKTISHFYWNRAKPRKGDLTFEKYLKTGAFPVDSHRWCRHNRLQVDFVGRFENLKEDLTTALARVGIDFDGWLPRAKGGKRDPKSRPYQRFLSDEAREKITRVFALEIELLGYRFEEKVRPPRLTREELDGQAVFRATRVISTAKRLNTQVISSRSDRQGGLEHCNDKIRRFEKIG